MDGEPSTEHLWLERLVGAWTYSSECEMGPGQPREHFEGTENVTRLGPFWAILDGEGEMPGGGTALTRMTLGYQPGEGYLGSWIGSMMPFMWRYAGTMSQDGTTLTLAAEGPSFSGDGSIASYEDIITLKGDNERTLISRVRQDDGSWREFVWVRYVRA